MTTFWTAKIESGNGSKTMGANNNTNQMRHLRLNISVLYYFILSILLFATYMLIEWFFLVLKKT